MRILHSRVSDDVHVVRNVNIKAKLDLKSVHIRTPALHAFFSHTRNTYIYVCRYNTESAIHSPPRLSMIYTTLNRNTMDSSTTSPSIE